MGEKGNILIKPGLGALHQDGPIISKNLGERKVSFVKEKKKKKKVT